MKYSVVTIDGCGWGWVNVTALLEDDLTCHQAMNKAWQLNKRFRIWPNGTVRRNPLPSLFMALPSTDVRIP